MLWKKFTDVQGKDDDRYTIQVEKKALMESLLCAWWGFWSLE